MGGLAIGLARMGAEFAFGTGSCVFPSPCPAIVCGVHYLYFSIIQFFCTGVLVLFISYNTPPIEDKHLHRLVFGLRFSKEDRIDLDRVQEEKARNARRQAEQKTRAMAEEETVESPPQTQSGLCRLIGWFCGVGGAQAPEPTEEEVTEASKQLPDIQEHPFWRYVVDANALVMMTVAIFFWGYYA